MTNISNKKIKLEQMKNRISLEQSKLKIKERKMRTRKLIELGGLIAKAKLDHLQNNTLFGALLSLKESLNLNPLVQNNWQNIGKQKFEEDQSKLTPVILKFDLKPPIEIRKIIRAQNLKWNRFRNEWYGNTPNLNSLKNSLLGINYSIEVLSN